MPSLSSGYLASLAFAEREVSILRNLGECRGQQELFVRQRPEVLESLKTVARIESTDASNRLEGITAPEARLKDLVLHQTAPQNRSEQEIAGYRDALELIHESRKDMPVTVNVIEQLHHRIYAYLPNEGGNWKTTDNQIVERGPEREIHRVRFEPTSAAATPQAMTDLVAQYDQAVADSREPLVVIPLFVLDFLCIHPFQDGNGRMARLLTLLLLYHFDYQVGRYISLERLFEQSREGYYETLEASSRGWHESVHDIHPWANYFWGVLRKAYGEFEERVGQLGSGRGSKSQHVRDAVGRQMRSFSLSDLERECPGVSRETIQHVLQVMRDEKLVELRGRGRGARWRRVGAA